jgi:hypothetical protein
MVKWLGVYLDHKFRFEYHVKSLAAKAKTVVNGISMLANIVRGLSHVLSETPISNMHPPGTNICKPDMVVWEKVPAQTTGACAMTSPPTDLQSSE